MLLTVESNPGPLAVRFGALNARSAVNKGALINDLIRENQLDILAVCESWIKVDDPDVIKNDIAPPNFSVQHVHRPRVCGNRRSKTKGGGLAFICSNDLSARPLKTQLSTTSFELQLVALTVNRAIVKIASVYRPPDKSQTIFIDEFANLLTTIGPGCSGERLLICGDFNMPGNVPGTIDERLSTLLDVHGYQQHVAQPTRGRNLLDLLIIGYCNVLYLLTYLAV